MRRPILTVVALALAASCLGPKPPPVSGPWPRSEASVVPVPEESPGLTVRLSEGSARVPKAPKQRPPVKVTPLGDREAERVLARLGPLDAPADDQKPWAIREGTLPPPRPGA